MLDIHILLGVAILMDRVGTMLEIQQVTGEPGLNPVSQFLLQSHSVWDRLQGYIRAAFPFYSQRENKERALQDFCGEDSQYQESFCSPY